MRRRSTLTLIVALCACSRDGAPRDSATDQPATANAAASLDSTCFRSPQSVLLGPPVGRRNVGHPPGWIRLVGLGHANGGEAELVDANGSRLGARWDRIARDSLRVVGFDDFLRTELRVVVAADSLRGHGTAHSDADVEVDSAGRPGEVRRAWQVLAARVTCDSMPRR